MMRVYRWVGAGDIVQRLDPYLLALGRIHLHVLPVHHLHAEVGPRADGVDDRPRIVSRSQNVNAFAEDLAAGHPVIDPAQQDQRGCQHGESPHINIAADGNIGVDQQEYGENEAVEPEHQQRAEVDLHTAAHDRRLVEIEVVGEHQADDGNDCNLQQPVLELQRIDRLVAQAEPGRGKKTATHHHSFTEQQCNRPGGIVDVQEADHLLARPRLFLYLVVSVIAIVAPCNGRVLDGIQH